MLKKLLKKIETIYTYRYLSKRETGSYDFLLKKVYKSTDINFIEKLWQLDHFREVLEPQALQLDTLKKVLVLAPHQDDEAIGCGGTLLQLKDLGCDIHLAFLTNGAELSNPQDSIPTRHTEAQKASLRLNAELQELGIDNISMKIEATHHSKLITWLNQDWDAVFTVWPLDQPPKHRVCSYLLGKAISASTYIGKVYFYAVHTDLLPSHFVDISENIEDKQELISIYASQLKAQRYDHMSKGMDAWRSRFLPVSNKKRYIETYMEIPAVAYMDFQRVYENSNMNELLKGNEVCIAAMRQLTKLT